MSCYRCLFPFDTTSHGQMTNCNAIFIDKIVPIVWYWYIYIRATTTTFPIPNITITSWDAFKDYLVTEDGDADLLNGCTVFVSLCGKVSILSVNICCANESCFDLFLRTITMIGICCIQIYCKC